MTYLYSTNESTEGTERILKVNKKSTSQLDLKILKGVIWTGILLKKKKKVYTGKPMKSVQMHLSLGKCKWKPHCQTQNDTDIKIGNCGNRRIEETKLPSIA